MLENCDKYKALALQFWCLSNTLTFQVRALEASKSQRACIILSQITRKRNTQLSIYNLLSTARLISISLTCYSYLQKIAIYGYLLSTQDNNLLSHAYNLMKLIACYLPVIAVFKILLIHSPKIVIQTYINLHWLCLFEFVVKSSSVLYIHNLLQIHSIWALGYRKIINSIRVYSKKSFIIWAYIIALH